MAAIRKQVCRVGVAGLFLAGTIALVGCSDDSRPESTASPAGRATPSPTAPKPSEAKTIPVKNMSEADLIEGGRSAYNANCIACHSMNPAQDGALGPAVAGASLDLLEARILRGEYPSGYVPKRNTRVMVPLPHLEPRLQELAAYLGSI